jgi:hypothetical protein
MSLLNSTQVPLEMMEMIQIPEEMQLPVAVAVSSKYRVPARGTIDLT